MRPSRRQAPVGVALGGVAGLLIGALALMLSLRDADPNRIEAAFARAGFGTLLLGTAIHVLVQAIYAARWRLLLGRPADLSVGRLFGFVGLGYLANYTLPARPGEVVRAGLAASLGGVAFVAALASLLLEKVLDGVTILASAGIIAANGVLPPWLRASIGIGAAAFLLGTIGLGFAAMATRGAATPAIRPATDGAEAGAWARAARFVLRQIEHVGAPARAIASPRTALAVAVLGVASWLAILAHFGILCLGVGIPAAPEAWLLLYTSFGLASVVPGAPGYLGTYQLAAVYALGIVGADPESAFVVATLYQLSRLLGSLIVAVVAIAREGTVVARLAARLGRGERSTREPA